jgi:hypothetical protein
MNNCERIYIELFECQSQNGFSFLLFRVLRSTIESGGASGRSESFTLMFITLIDKGADSNAKTKLTCADLTFKMFIYLSLKYSLHFVLL